MPEQIPQARAVPRTRTRLSLVWVVPIVAAVAGAWVAATRILAEGPTITIVLDSAEGLEAGKTKIHYNGVDVGTLTTIRLSDDHRKVIATAQMAPKTNDFLVDDTHFWVVRPRISGSTVSGLGTLISGAYLGMEIGRSTQPKRDFVALVTPPVVTEDVPGRFFVLKTATLGSLDYGTPIYFRHLQVGEVSSYELDPDGQALTVKVFVNAPYDQFVTDETRFWQASGIDLSLTASGLTVQTQSLLSILVGGIAFETPEGARGKPAAAANTTFTLFASHGDAFEAPVHNPQTYMLRFAGSVRGLTPGAPVLLRGIRIGEVSDIEPQLDAKTFDFSVKVLIRVDPLRLGVKLVGEAPEDAATRHRGVDALVAHGVRAQLQTGSLLTGSLFVAFDFFPDAPPVTVDWTREPVELPTIPGEVEQIEANVTSIIKKLDQLPLQAIGDDVRKALVELDHTLSSARGTLDSADKLIAPNSTLEQQLGATLGEVSGAARSLRLLADYLERHPEALLRGKTGEAQ